jgi:hypothetical protein
VDDYDLKGNAVESHKAERRATAYSICPARIGARWSPAKPIDEALDGEKS